MSTFSTGISAPFDAEDALGDIDWGPLDKLVERYRGHGIMLIQGAENLRFTGEGSAPSAAYDTAYAVWMRRLAQHLSDQGLAYSDWAIYIVDEPGLEHGPRIKYLLEQGRRIKAADPHIQTYTDPIVVMGPDDLERAAPDVDIWCPQQDSLYRIWGPTPDMHPRERLAIMRGDSSEVWTYECFPRVKRLSPLGYYRHQAWLAWTLGLNGMGFWTYCTSPDNPWTPTKDEYLLVYPAATAPSPASAGRRAGTAWRTTRRCGWRGKRWRPLPPAESPARRPPVRRLTPSPTQSFRSGRPCPRSSEHGSALRI